MGPVLIAGCVEFVGDPKARAAAAALDAARAGL